MVVKTLPLALTVSPLFPACLVAPFELATDYSLASIHTLSPMGVGCTKWGPSLQVSPALLETRPNRHRHGAAAATPARIRLLTPPALV